VFDDRLETGGRNRQVKSRTLGTPKLFPQRLIRCRVPIVASHVAPQAAQLLESRWIEPPVLLQAVAGPGPDLAEVLGDLATPITGTLRWPLLTIA
jgi:hypothetical protein